MIPEDQNQMCSNTSDGGGGTISRSSSKKLKQKKVPQRGLGVAQLEKIRMEEQQFTDANNLSSSPKISPTNSSSLPTVPLPNYPLTNTNHRPSKPNQPPNPPSPPVLLPMNLPPPNPIFRTRSLPNTENFNLDSVPSPNPTNGDGLRVGWPSIPVHGHGSFPRMWHPRSPHELSPDHRVENSGSRPSLGLPYDTCHIASLPDVLPWTTQQHQPPPSDSLVNVSPINLSSSSVLSFPMEPPSNQSFYSNYSPLWPDEEKMMVGMKRSCPFPLDNPPIPTFHSKLSPVAATRPLSRSDESTSGAFEGTMYNHLDSDIPSLREVPSCPSAMPEPVNSRKISKSEHGNSHTGDFLSLDPSPFTSFPNPRSKQFCKTETSAYQVSIENPLLDSRQGGSSQQQPNLFNFFPPSKLHGTTSTSASATHNLCKDEVGENIDLNLRL